MHRCLPQPQLPRYFVHTLPQPPVDGQKSTNDGHGRMTSLSRSSAQDADEPFVPTLSDQSPRAVAASGERKVIDQVIGRLTQNNPDVADEEVADIVNASYARFDGRPIRDFVPLFVERDARTQLAQIPEHG
jgi:hypothetical protein